MLRRKSQGRLLRRARFASGGLALFRLGCEQTGRGGGVGSQKVRTWYPQGDPSAQSFFSATATKSVAVTNEARTDCTAGIRFTDSSPLEQKTSSDTYLSEAMKAIVGKKE